MFEHNDTLKYLPGGVIVTVTEVHDRHIVAVTDDDMEEYVDIYEDEYDQYEKVKS